MRFKACPLLAMFAACAAALVFAEPARASSRIVLDRVVAEPSYVEGRARVRAFVSPLTLEGQLLEGDDTAGFELRAGGAPLRAPYVEGRFSSQGIELALALVVEVASDYEAVLPTLKREFGALLRALPRSARIAVVAYGGQIEGGHRLESPHRARERIESLLPDLDPQDPQLIGAGERALRALSRAEADEGGLAPRKVMVVLSDGRDTDPQPERYRDLGDRAARDDVRIHSIAYSPVDNRRPLLGLGELSKRSGGTFRWVRDPRGISSHVENLRAELLEQPVLTFFPPASEIAGSRLAIALGDLESEPARIRELSCGGEVCEGEVYCAGGRCVQRHSDGGIGLLGWIVRIAIGLLVLFAALLALGFVLSRREEAARQRAGAAPAAGQSDERVPAQAPGGKIAPTAPGGGSAPSQPPSGQIPPQRPAGTGAPPTAASGHAQPAPATLFVVSGPRQGQRIPLRHGFAIGKGKRCDLVVPGDAQVGEHHAQILVDAAGGYILVDQGAPGGTFVNGVRATQMRLAHGASIRIGTAELRFLTS